MTYDRLEEIIASVRECVEMEGIILDDSDVDAYITTYDGTQRGAKSFSRTVMTLKELMELCELASPERMNT